MCEGTNKNTASHVKTNDDSFILETNDPAKKKKKTKTLNTQQIPGVRCMYESFKVNDSNMMMLSCCCCVHWL